MMKILFPIFLFLLVIPTSFEKCFAKQQSVVDSLLQVLETAKEDTNKVNVLNDLCWEYSDSKPEKALKYCKEALDLAKKIKYDNGEADSYNNTGIVYKQQGSYKEALNCFLQALEFDEKWGNKKGMAAGYNNIGLIYRNQGNYTEALKYLIKSLKISEERKDKKNIAASLSNIGIIFSYQGNYTDALRYFLQSSEIFEDIGDKQGMASAYTGIGITYSYQEKYTEAIKYYGLSLILKKEFGDKNGEANSYNNIGILYYEKDDYEKALENYVQAMQLFKETGDQDGIAKSYMNIGGVYLEQGEYENAIEYFNKSLTIANKTGEIDGVQYSHYGLALTYAKLKNYEKAYEHQQEFMTIKDSVFNEAKSMQIAEMQTKYETEKKEKENELLTKQNEIQTLQISRNRYLIYGLTGVVVLVMIIAFLFIQQNKLRAVHRSMELEQKLLRSQMNPHFIFNSLIAIQGYIYKKDPKEAGKYLASFAKLMRLILENSREEYVTLEKEIQTLEHYLELQGLRFENKFDYGIDIDSSIDTETLAIPPMLAQPFIENALEHGIQNKDTGGKIIVRFSLEGGLVLLEVEDNGIGRHKAEEQKQGNKNVHQSLATTITQERLAILNKKNKQKIKLEITDLKSQDDEVVGTKATFSIPFRNI